MLRGVHSTIIVYPPKLDFVCRARFWCIVFLVFPVRLLMLGVTPEVLSIQYRMHGTARESLAQVMLAGSLSLGVGWSLLAWWLWGIFLKVWNSGSLRTLCVFCWLPFWRLLELRRLSWAGRGFFPNFFSPFVLSDVYVGFFWCPSGVSSIKSLPEGSGYEAYT